MDRVLLRQLFNAFKILIYFYPSRFLHCPALQYEEQDVAIPAYALSAIPTALCHSEPRHHRREITVQRNGFAPFVHHLPYTQTLSELIVVEPSLNTIQCLAVVESAHCQI